MKLGNTLQRYFNFMVEIEMKKEKGVEISKLLEQFKITRNTLKVLKELKYIEKVENPTNNKKSHWYTWVSNKKPTMDIAEEVIFYVNDGIKAYNKGNKPAPIVRKKTTQPVIPGVVKMKPFTDEMCIEHLKKSVEYVYEIFRYKKERIL
jgi:hypothetical protein